MEAQVNQEVTEVRCSVCNGWLVDALTGSNHDFYRNALKCVNCGRLWRLLAGCLMRYTGRGE